MSMRNYGVEQAGLILTCSQMTDLIKKSLENLYKKGTFNRDDKLEDCIETDLYDVVLEFGFTYWGEIDGEILSLDKFETRQILNFDDVVLVELDNDSLYKSYKDENEIYKELLDKLTDLGFVVDLDFIKNHTGWLCGTYCS